MGSIKFPVDLKDPGAVIGMVLTVWLIGLGIRVLPVPSSLKP